MNCRYPVGPAALLLFFGGFLLLGVGGCRKREGGAGSGDKVAVAVPAVLQTNNLGDFPGAVYRSQAGSPIHWQAWTQESLDRAKETGRLVFAVVILPQQPDFLSVLQTMDQDRDLVATINDTYVPILIDADAAREIGILTAELCAERDIPLHLPLFLWLTGDANPVAWIPAGNSSTVVDVFSRSHSMVHQSLQESPDYVATNSRNDNASRRERISQVRNSHLVSREPAEDTTRGIRQLASFYDSFSHSFDEAGGLFPAGSLDLLATAAVHPGLNPELRDRCLEVTRDLLGDLLPSAMFDPLTGGVFSGRRGKSWTLPSFQQDCPSQAWTAVALIDAYRATGNRAALEKALGVIAFAEKTFATPDGLFSVGLTDLKDPKSWLWTVEQIQEAIPPKDAAWWIKATGMTAMGNISAEVDPQRKFFRMNSMGLQKSISQLAEDAGQSSEEFSAHFESIRKALLKKRAARLGVVPHDNQSHAGATFRMITAYAAAFAATGEEAYRTKAVDLMEKAQAAFMQGPRLQVYPGDAPASVGQGRAFLYGLAMLAALDVAAITPDEKWAVWCEDLATTAAEIFSDGAFLKECPDAARLIDLPISDLVMLFDDSTAGLISMAECRLADRGRPLLKSFSELATPLPINAVTNPVLHTDLLMATLAREFKVTLVVPDQVPEELATVVHRLPIRMVQRRAARPTDQVPAGSILVISPDGGHRMVTSAAALQEAVLPSATKP